MTRPPARRSSLGALAAWLRIELATRSTSVIPPTAAIATPTRFRRESAVVAARVSRAISMTSPATRDQLNATGRRRDLARPDGPRHDRPRGLRPNADPRGEAPGRKHLDRAQGEAEETESPCDGRLEAI